ncbi:unnamed protein product, partial [Ixodes pacificus]
MVSRRKATRWLQADTWSLPQTRSRKATWVTAWSSWPWFTASSMNSLWKMATTKEGTARLVSSIFAIHWRYCLRRSSFWMSAKELSNSFLTRLALSRWADTSLRILPCTPSRSCIFSRESRAKPSTPFSCAGSPPLEIFSCIAIN